MLASIVRGVQIVDDLHLEAERVGDPVEELGRGREPLAAASLGAAAGVVCVPEPGMEPLLRVGRCLDGVDAQQDRILGQRGEASLRAGPIESVDGAVPDLEERPPGARVERMPQVMGQRVDVDAGGARLLGVLAGRSGALGLLGPEAVEFRVNR